MEQQAHNAVNNLKGTAAKVGVQLSELGATSAVMWLTRKLNGM